MAAPADIDPRLRRSGPEVEEPASSVLAALVNARGAIDADHAGPFRHELARAVDAGATKLLVDLGQADEVTATGMNVLLAARQQLLERGGQIAVVLPRLLRKRFELLGLDGRLFLASSRLQAAQALGLAGRDERPAPAPAPFRPHARAA